MPVCKMEYEYKCQPSIRLYLAKVHRASMIFRFIHVSLLLLLLTAGWAQQRRYVFQDAKLIDSLTVQDTVSIQAAVNDRLLNLWKQGHLYAGMDSIAADSIYLHRGASYNVILDAIYSYDAYYDSLKTTIPKSGSLYWITARKKLHELINEGHPFASISMTRIHRESDLLHASLLIDPGPSIVYDSLALLNAVDVSASFLERVLDVRPGMPYSEDAFLGIPRKLKRLPFVQLRQTPDVTFAEGKTTIYLDLEDLQQSSFEGVIGFLPNQSVSNELVITGYLDLYLANLFRSGKSLGINWNRFADQSQSADILYTHPYLFSSPLFANFNLNILKQDSSFLQQMWKLELGTNLWSTSELVLGYEQENGSLIDATEVDLRTGIADYQSGMYTLGLRSAYYHLPFSFGKDLKYRIGVSLGDKKISKNPAVDASFYDTLSLQTSRLRLAGGFRYQLPVSSGLAFYHSMSGQVLVSDQLLRNEFNRIGGLNSLRGFNENFFFARNFFLSRMELRQYFEQNSYLMLFCDVSALRDLNSSTLPMGAGLGLSLNTSSGLFTFATAIGWSEDISADFTNVKVHLGYISRF